MRFVLLCLAVSLSLLQSASWAATPLRELRLSADSESLITASNGSGLLLGDDETLFIVNPEIASGNVMNLLPGPTFADPYDVDAYHSGSFVAYSLDISTLLGGVLVRPADAFVFNGGVTLIFDSQAAGVPDGANLDALSEVPGVGDLLLSFDTTVQLQGQIFLPADVLRVLSDGSVSLFFDGLRLPSGMNVDAIHALDNGHLLFSTDSAGRLPGLDFTREDILEFDPVLERFELAFRTRELHPRWLNADVDALAAQRRLQAGQTRFETTRVVEVLENEGPVVLRVLRVGGSEGGGEIAYRTTPGSAGPADYQAFDLTFLYNDGDTFVRNLTVQITDDALVEGIEEFSVDLSVLSGDVGLGSPSRAVIRILDDEVFIFKNSFE